MALKAGQFWAQGPLQADWPSPSLSKLQRLMPRASTRAFLFYVSATPAGIAPCAIAQPVSARPISPAISVVFFGIHVLQSASALNAGHHTETPAAAVHSSRQAK